MSFEKIRVESQKELEEMITKDVGLVEKDLTLICNSIPINGRTTLDILCHDENGQLVIIQLNVTEDDVMLLQAIQSWDYVDKFKSFLKATYSKHKIDDNEKPRLVLIAPSFSDALRRAAESMKGIRLNLYEWEYLKLGDHKGLRLQPISDAIPAGTLKEEKETEKRREQKASKKKDALPEQEPESKKEEELAPDKPKPDQPKEPKTEEYPDLWSKDQQSEPKKKLKLF